MAGIATVAAIPALVFSYARGAILALAIASLVWFGLRRPRVAILAALAAAGIAFVFTPSALRERFNPSTGQQDVPLRADIWSSAVDIYSGHPILGVGLGNFSFAYASLPSTLANASQRRLLNQHGLIVPPNAQNLYLGVLAEEGIVGLAALTLLAILVPAWSRSDCASAIQPGERWRSGWAQACSRWRSTGSSRSCSSRGARVAAVRARGGRCGIRGARSCRNRRHGT